MTHLPPVDGRYDTETILASRRLVALLEQEGPMTILEARRRHRLSSPLMQNIKFYLTEKDPRFYEDDYIIGIRDDYDPLYNLPRKEPSR